MTFFEKTGKKPEGAEKKQSLDCRPFRQTGKKSLYRNPEIGAK